MLRKPHALKALLLRVGDLLQRFMTALRFAVRGPGFGNLNLVEQANSHENRLLHSAGHCLTPRIRAAKSCPTNTLDGGEAQHANPADQLSTAAGARRSLPLRVHHRCAPGVTRSLARNRGFAGSPLEERWIGTCPADARRPHRCRFTFAPPSPARYAGRASETSRTVLIGSPGGQAGSPGSAARSPPRTQIP